MPPSLGPIEQSSVREPRAGRYTLRTRQSGFEERGVYLVEQLAKAPPGSCRVFDAAEDAFEAVMTGASQSVAARPEHLLVSRDTSYEGRLAEEPARSVRAAFALAFGSRGERREALAEKITTDYSAPALVRAALAEFEEKGNQDRLLLAVDLLELYEPRKACSGYTVGVSSAYADYFVEALVEREDIDVDQRLSLLIRVAREGMPAARRRLADALEDASDELLRPIAEQLVEDPDPETAGWARARLALSSG